MSFGFGDLTGEFRPGDVEEMHFAFGKRSFYGYWTQPDGSEVFFSNLRVPADNLVGHALGHQIEEFERGRGARPKRRRQIHVVLKSLIIHRHHTEAPACPLLPCNIGARRERAAARIGTSFAALFGRKVWPET